MPDLALCKTNKIFLSSDLGQVRGNYRMISPFGIRRLSFRQVMGIKKNHQLLGPIV